LIFPFVCRIAHSEQSDDLRAEKKDKEKKKILGEEGCEIRGQDSLRLVLWSLKFDEG